MAIIGNQDYQAVLAPRATELGQEQPQQNIDTPSFFKETVPAAIFRASPTAAFIQEQMQPIPKRADPNSDYNPIDEAVAKGYTNNLGAFAKVNNEDQFNTVADYVNKVNEYDNVLANSGAAGITASMVSGALDPTGWIGGWGAARAVTRTGMILKNTLAGSAAGLLGGAAYEAASARQFDVPYDISVPVYSAMFAGAIGGAYGAISATERGFHADMLNRILNNENTIIDASTAPKPGGEALKNINKNIGAAEYKPTENNVININDKVLQYSLPGFLKGPILKGLTSPSPFIKKVTNDLFEHPYFVGKDITGERLPSVESLIKSKADRVAGDVNRILQDTYLKEKQTPLTNTDGTPIVDANGKPVRYDLKWDEFNSNMDRLLRSDSPKTGRPSDHAVIQLRNILDEQGNRLVKSGILDNKLDEPYLRRIYNVPYLTTQQGAERFISDASQHFQRKMNVEPAAAERLALTTYENIVGLGDNSTEFNRLAKSNGLGSGFTKHRVLDMTDEQLDPYLVHNSSENITNYIQKTEHMIQMKDWLTNNGFENMNDVLKKLKEEYDAKGLYGDTVKQYNADKELLQSQLEIMMGQYGRGGNIKVSDSLNILRKFQTMASLGGVTVSSISDLAMPLFVHGPVRAIINGWLPLFKNLKLANLSRKELRWLAGGIDQELSTRLRAMTDPEFQLNRNYSGIDRLMDKSLNFFGNATLMNQWNKFGQRNAAHVSASRIIDGLLAERAGKLSQKELQKLSSLGLNSETRAKILAQWDRVGVKKDGTYFLDAHHWNDQSAIDAMGAAIRKDMDQTILMPGKGDLPFMARSELGKTLFQFQSFPFTATNKLLLSGLQRRDQAVAIGLMGLLGMGILTHILKETIAGRKIDFEDIPKLIANGMDRSGMLGYMGNVLFGLNPFGTSSRYAGRTIENFLLGPVASNLVSLIQDTSNATNHLIKNQFTWKDAQKFVKYVPFANLFYLKILFRKLGETL